MKDKFTHFELFFLPKGITIYQVHHVELINHSNISSTSEKSAKSRNQMWRHLRHINQASPKNHASDLFLLKNKIQALRHLESSPDEVSIQKKRKILGWNPPREIWRKSTDNFSHTFEHRQIVCTKRTQGNKGEELNQLLKLNSRRFCLPEKMRSE